MILYTLDTDKWEKKFIKTAYIYLLISLFFLLFGAVYEIFSHEVYSFYMIYAFAFPLVGGTLPFLTLGILRVRKYPNTISKNLYHGGIITLTIGSVLSGVLEIYGTTNALVVIYWVVGIPMVVLGAIIYGIN